MILPIQCLSLDVVASQTHTHIRRGASVVEYTLTHIQSHAKHHPNTNTNEHAHLCSSHTPMTHMHTLSRRSLCIWYIVARTQRHKACAHSQHTSFSLTYMHTHTSNLSYTSFVVCVCMFIDSIAVHVLRSFPVAHTHTNAVWMWIFRLLHILADWIVVIVIITINHFTLFDAIRMDDTLLWMRTCVRVCEPFQYISNVRLYLWTRLLWTK